MPASKLVEPLRGADAKVKRADENIRELNAVVRSFLDQTEFPTIFKQRMKDGTHVFSHGRTAVDDDISVRIGEVIHNLRSALDHTYYAVVLSHCVATRTRLLTPDEERATQFPICRKAVDYPGMRAGKIEPWVPADALALLDGFQPCNNPPADDYFTQIISDLNNRDKHRLLVTGWAQLDTPPAVFSNVRAQFEAGQEISPETEVYRQRATDIEFIKVGTRERRSVMPCLIHLAHATKGLVNAFRPLFWFWQVRIPPSTGVESPCRECRSGRSRFRLESSRSA